jgi:hypothetical protein
LEIPQAAEAGAQGLKLRACLAALACAAAWAHPAQGASKLDELSVRLLADLTWDDNVNRATNADRLSDAFATLNVDARLPFSVTERTRLLLGVSGGGQGYDRYDGLTHSFVGLQGEFQFRSSADFGAPIWSAFIREQTEWYRSNLRDGYNASAGVSVRKPWTDRMLLFGAAAYNWRDGRSVVFDAQDWSLRGNLDYSLTNRQTAYFGLEYRDGDAISTAPARLAYLDIAEAVVLDDVFTNPVHYDYRYKARTGILTLGYNLAVGTRQALDLSYRAAYAVPKEQPPSTVSPDTLYYLDQQVTLSYLLRF